jgi:hypothetical protein
MALVQVAYHTGVPEPNVSALIMQLDTEHGVPHEIIRKESPNWYRLLTSPPRR